ncbi:MAG TPA: biotin--[acetyl-CoA-carboxylase] ligase [Gaiellaceae bacterium]|jgi:BirA family biotin operon repressor/biotin-[acetyl-CoA-carboxylase] ligase|nr:biotin--[acetyl-CoA-carboxylase] ligase [Gaiellaceae bacterium]
MDSLDPQRVVPLLRGRLGRPYRYLESCPSTQRELAADDAEGAVVATGHQTAGRGRLGRAWTDAPGTGLLFSLLLRPDMPPERLPELTVVVADAVAEAIGPGTTLKEPNDVLLNGRKVAGVLGEASEGRVVIGIGINANQARGQVPGGTRLPATSIRVERGAPVDRAELLAAILEALERRYDAWLSAGR